MEILSLLESLLKLSIVTMIGLYFIFSNTIMRALAAFEHAAKIMNELNKVILNPWFLTAFFTSAVASVYFLVLGDGLQIIAGGVFLFGNVLVTMVKNVPLNNRLLAVDKDHEQLSIMWQQYLKQWLFWNHMRTFSAVIAGALLLI